MAIACADRNEAGNESKPDDDQIPLLHRNQFCTTYSTGTDGSTDTALSARSVTAHNPSADLTMIERAGSLTRLHAVCISGACMAQTEAEFGHTFIAVARR